MSKRLMPVLVLVAGAGLLFGCGKRPNATEGTKPTDGAKAAAPDFDQLAESLVNKDSGWTLSKSKPIEGGVYFKLTNQQSGAENMLLIATKEGFDAWVPDSVQVFKKSGMAMDDRDPDDGSIRLYVRTDQGPIADAMKQLKLVPGKGTVAVKVVSLASGREGLIAWAVVFGSAEGISDESKKSAHRDATQNAKTLFRASALPPVKPGPGG
jgi:hypothetical protein